MIKKNEKKGNPIPVVLVPKWVSVEEGGKDTKVSLCYIKAELSMDGKLKADQYTPVVWSTCMEAPCSKGEVSFETKEVDKSKISIQDNGWIDIDSFKSLYEEHYGIEFDSDKIGNVVDGEEVKIEKEPDDKWVVMRCEDIDAKNGIISLVKYLKKNSECRPALLRTMLMGGNVRDTTELPKLGEALHEHLGQMKNKLPLADAQRQAVHCASRLHDGEVLAVSGPPGTGKTTLLQSVVADMVVKYALAGKKAPVILVCSSNNKAVRNVIEAFEFSDENGDERYQRWVRYDGKQVPFSVYYVSNQNKKEGDYTDQVYKDSVRDKIEDLRKCFVATANAHGYAGEVAEIKANLLRELKAKAEEITGQQEQERKVEIPWWNVLARMFRCHRPQNKTISLEEAAKKDKEFDTNQRYDCFWLAVHYYEACWFELCEANDELKQSKEQRCRLDDIDECACLCPCVIATFFRAPGFFKKGEEREMGYADLLVVDEAGMVCNEIGLPTFALAKKAVVVGDMNQIPPIYEMKDDQSKGIWQAKVGTMSEDFYTLDCSGSSVMRVASERSRFNRGEENDKRGVLLREHFRCYNEIIAYCNKLIYKGDLLPMRGNSRESRFPVMAHCLVPAEKSEVVNGSRRNEAEAKSIVAWLRRNKEAILTESKGKSLMEAVNIITPFKCQADLIKHELMQAGIVEKDNTGKVVGVGTVHTFQGAEAPFVIYSTTYGSTEKFGFIKGNEQLMNVAVSRAKDHFFVFSSVERGTYKDSGDPVGLLLEYTSVSLPETCAAGVPPAGATASDGVPFGQTFPRPA